MGVYEYNRSKYKKLINYYFQIGEIISSFIESKNSKACCEYIIKEASSRWIKNENSIDDISIILLFLENEK